MEYRQVDVAIFTAVIIIAWLGTKLWHRASSKGLRPPGPTCYPLVGNLFQMPFSNIGFYFQKVSKKYGKIVMLQVGSQKILVLGDRNLAHELLAVRSSNYFGRMSLPHFHNCNPDGRVWATISDKDLVGTARKLSGQAMRTVIEGKTGPVSEYHALLLARSLLLEPAAWMQHVVSAVIGAPLTLSFGPEGSKIGLPLIKSVMDAFVEDAQIGGSIINFLPFLQWVPLIPKPWQKRAVQFRRLTATFDDAVRPADETAEAASPDTWHNIFAKTPGGDALLRTLIMGASETGPVVQQNFVLTCLLHGGDFHAAAQRQIDTVVGSERPPSFADRTKLPLVEAIFREVIRYRPATATGIPHVSLEDDVVEYQGKQYFIPAGTAVFAAPSAIEHDPVYYPNPEVYDPSRFLDEKGQLLPNYHTSAFGYGGRGCPGRAFGERTAWVNIVTMLWLFNIRKVPGFEYRDDESFFKEDLSCRPIAFPVVFEPRDKRRVEVVQHAYEAQSKDPPQLL